MHYAADPPHQTSAAAFNSQAFPPRFEQPVRQPSREERLATDDPLEAIFEVSVGFLVPCRDSDINQHRMLHFVFQTINKITDAIKYGIQTKYDGVRDSTRQLRTKLLVRAMEDLDELHEDKYDPPAPTPSLPPFCRRLYHSIILTFYILPQHNNLQHPPRPLPSLHLLHPTLSRRPKRSSPRRRREPERVEGAD